MKKLKWLFTTVQLFNIYIIFQELNKVNDALEKPALLVPTSEQVVQMEQASAMAAEVTSSMLTQKLELDDKKRSVSMLQKALVCIFNP